MQNTLKKGIFAAFEHVFSLEWVGKKTVFCKIIIPHLTKQRSCKQEKNGNTARKNT